MSGADWNTTRENQPPAPTSETQIEVDVVAKRCVYVNSYRIAGSKPYVSENLPSHTLKTTLGDVLNAFTEKQIRAFLREKKARRDYYASVHAQRVAEQVSA